MSTSQTGTTNVNVHVALDLGSDTLKIAYAYKRGSREYTGKIVHSGDTMTALPAVAFYDSDNGRWHFCEEVPQQQGKSFLTVVKIKRLICLLLDTKSSRNSNANYYNNEYHFPKFYFSLSNDGADGKDDDDFAKLVKKQGTFVANGFTPKRVCEMYFSHVADIVNNRLTVLMKKKHKCEYNLHVSVVYPPHIGNGYVKELERLVQYGFDIKHVSKVLSMTKALSIYSVQRELLHVGESALIFNVGEEKTFVAKTQLLGDGISIDGVEGHLPAIDLGGNDIDRAVAVYLEKSMYDRETMGSPPAGTVGHIYERGLSTKLYLFLQEIKYAKIIFGMYDRNAALFKNGVPINASRDLYIRLRLTHDEFCKCIGIKKDGTAAANSFVDKLCKHIETELSNSINRNVSHVFISGGVVETFGLVDVIKARLKNNPHITVETFESDSSKPYNSGSDGFEIFAHEDAVYAPAVGCAIAALNNISVKTVTSLAYGTDAYVASKGVFSLLLDKNQEIPEEGRAPDVQPYYVRSGSVDASMLIFSLNLSAQEIYNKTFANDDEVNVEYTLDRELSLEHVINKFKNHRVESYVNSLEKKIGFRQRNLDKDAVITFHYRNKRVKLATIIAPNRDDRLDFDAGIKIDGAGVATPYVRNNIDKNNGKQVKIVELEEQLDGSVKETHNTATVWATEIEVKCKPFTVMVEGKD